MFAVVNHLQFNKPVDSFKDELQSEGMPILSKLEGFVDFHFIKVDETHAIAILLWADGASAQAGAKAFGPTWFATHLKPFLVGAENRSVGPVIATTRNK